MLTKRLLILTPLLFSLLLIQAYFWVPTYEAQTTGNPARLDKFIEASIGDAKILNPALHADAASGRIVDQVFEGLLGLDENLELRGRLAQSWELRETAYLIAIPGAATRAGPVVDAAQLARAILAGVSDGRLDLPTNLLEEIDVEPAVERTISFEPRAAADGARETTLRVRVPARVRFRLRRVDQDFFTRLLPLLGDDYAGEDPGYAGWLAPGQEPDEAALTALAERLPIFEHNPELVFRLRPGVRFHDGHELDAGDVRFTYEAIMNPRNLSPRTSDFEPIASVQVLDPLTVRVVYKRLFSPAVSAWTMGILPEHLLDADALRREMDARALGAQARESFGLRDSGFNRAPIGTGPFRFVQWQSDELLHLTRNEDYWEGAPEYHDYFYRVIPDTLTQEVEFRTGAIDGYTPEPYQVARYRRDGRYQAFSSLSTGYTYIGFNNRRPLLSDPRVRRALGMALNTREIIEYVLYGEGERITGPYPKTTDWYAPDLEPLPYDPAAAQQALRELGWRRNADGWLEKDGRIFEFNLITNNGNQTRRAILSIAQDAWRRIGVKCNTQVFEWAVFLQDFVNPGDFDAVILGWQMGVDPDLFQLWHSSQAGPNQLNFVGYTSERADRLIERIRREYDRDEQVRLARELHALIARDQPYTFLFAPRATRVLDRKIVMLEADGRPGPLRATRSGDLFYYFNRWRKLEHAPAF